MTIFYETLSIYLRCILQDVFPDEKQQTFSITFFCDAFYSSIRRWLTSREIMPVEEFLDHIHEVLEKSALLFLETDGPDKKTKFSS